MAAQIVFVYGTLRRGECNHPVMMPYMVRALGKGRIRGQLYDLGAYPAIDISQSGVVTGEWTLVTEEGLKRLDLLEEYPEYYDRTIVTDVTRQIQGWVYHMTGRIPRNAVRIGHGDWVLWRKGRVRQ
jgi:gamma-glutamylcyclotransferase (GGCT)/AIG2-like uncharacterized protein YtfP